VITDLATRMQSGETLADALAAHRGVFGEVYVSCVRAAEKSGTLTAALDLLAQMLERQQELRQKVVGALMYPLCVLGLLVVAVGFLLGYVVPKFARMFESRGVELPAITKAMAAVGDSVQGYWFVYVGVIVGTVFGVRRAWRTAGGRARLEGLLHRVPRIGAVMQGLAIARFSRVLGLCLGAGLGLIDSLELASRAGGRAALTADVQRLMTQVRVGGRLGEVLTQCPFIPGFARRMYAAGETSAEMPKMCVLVARHYERESEYTAKNLSTLIEPLLIVGITGIVLVVALAIFLPMWDMAKLVG
jgi:type II secretory pathway component PulF